MQTKEIGATSRVSFKQVTKSGDVFYTFEFNETLSLNEFDQPNLETIKQQLWKSVNDQVTNQVIETKNLYKPQIQQQQ